MTSSLLPPGPFTIDAGELPHYPDKGQACTIEYSAPLANVCELANTKRETGQSIGGTLLGKLTRLILRQTVRCGTNGRDSGSNPQL